MLIVFAIPVYTNLYIDFCFYIKKVGIRIILHMYNFDLFDHQSSIKGFYFHVVT